MAIFLEDKDEDLFQPLLKNKVVKDLNVLFVEESREPLVMMT